MKTALRWLLRGLIGLFALVGLSAIVLVGIGLWEKNHKISKAPAASAQRPAQPVARVDEGPEYMNPEDRKLYVTLMAKEYPHPFLNKGEVVAMIFRYKKGGCGDMVTLCIATSIKIGRHFEQGDRSPKDERQALRWYFDAAQIVPEPSKWTDGEQCGYSPVPDARPFYEIARMYEEGKGVPQDLLAAYRWAVWADLEAQWLNRHEMRNWGEGDPVAVAEQIAQQASPALERISAKLTPEQRASAWPELDATILPEVPPDIPPVDNAAIAAVVTPEAIAMSGCADGDEEIIGWAPAPTRGMPGLDATLPLWLPRREDGLPG